MKGQPQDPWLMLRRATANELAPPPSSSIPLFEPSVLPRLRLPWAKCPR